MTHLLQLAVRCEHAESPCRVLDAEIWRAIPEHATNADKTHVFWSPRYTSSLDAAASLIPNGHDWIIEHVNDGLTIGARVGHNDSDRTSWGSTAALALAASALRARAAA